LWPSVQGYGRWNARPKLGPDTNLYNCFGGFRFGQHSVAAAEANGTGSLAESC
jgi:hypothetical protein